MIDFQPTFLIIKLKLWIIFIYKGIYINQNDENVPFKYRGIGIRIEDDVVIGNDKCEILSRNTPKSIDEIENLLK